MITFIEGRINSLKYALEGMIVLIKTEHSIITHTIVGVILTFMGFYFDISQLDWIIQLGVIAVVLAVEGLNTAIEKLCDFIHPNFDKRIGFIKDISAGSVSFVVLMSTVILAIIYYPYLTH